MKTSVLKGFFFSLLVLSVSALSQAADQYTFDLSEIEKKAYSLGGFLEFRPVLFGLDRDSPFYRLKFFDQDPGSTLEQYNFGLRLEGSYEKGNAGFFFRTDGILRYEEVEGWDKEINLLDGYLSLKPGTNSSVNAGKRVVPWGKGYAFNPAAFVSRPKDADDPTEALEGYYVIDADFIKSFEGPLKTLAFTPVILPVAGDINEDFGETDGVNFAARLYLLLWDTDLDFMFFTGRSRTTRYGFDFSRNIRTNLEIHGELAWITDFEKKSIDPRGNLSTGTSDVPQALLGIRYLTEDEITWIIEYYHNGGGLETADAENFYLFADDAYSTFLSGGGSSQLARASRLSQGTLAGSRPMRDYLYVRASWKEPFEILYFTPAATSILNLEDLSMSLTPELIYTPITNLEIRLRSALLLGGPESEFGEKQNDYRLELRLRYYL
jgi:hypothetical protein